MKNQKEKWKKLEKKKLINIKYILGLLALKLKTFDNMAKLW